MALTPVSPSPAGRAGGSLLGFPEHTLTTGTKMLNTALLDPRVRWPRDTAPSAGTICRAFGQLGLHLQACIFYLHNTATYLSALKVTFKRPVDNTLPLWPSLWDTCSHKILFALHCFIWGNFSRLHIIILTSVCIPNSHGLRVYETNVPFPNRTSCFFFFY